MDEPRVIVVRLPAIVAIIAVIVLLLCIIFPPQRWDDQIRSYEEPERGFILTPHARIKEWQSPHMYLDRRAAHDYRRLAWECVVIIAVGGVLCLASVYIDRKFIR